MWGKNRDEKIKQNCIKEKLNVKRIFIYWRKKRNDIQIPAAFFKWMLAGIQSLGVLYLIGYFRKRYAVLYENADI